MSERAEQRGCYVETPKDGCGKCGSTDLTYHFIVCGGTEALMVRYICNECGWQTNLPQLREKPKQRRPNEQARWAIQVKWRDHEKCVICGSEDGIVAHHIIPYANCPSPVYAWNVRNGVTLCRKCHELVHPWMKKEEEPTA